MCIILVNNLIYSDIFFRKQICDFCFNRKTTLCLEGTKHIIADKYIFCDKGTGLQGLQDSSVFHAGLQWHKYKKGSKKDKVRNTYTEFWIYSVSLPSQVNFKLENILVYVALIPVPS